MKKFALLFIFGLIISPKLFAQEDDFYSFEETEQKNNKGKNRSNKLERWNFGGNFWLSFSSHSAYIEASPVALYQATPRLLIGPGISYRYIKRNLYNPYHNRYEVFKYNSYGPRAIASFTVLQNIDEAININIGNIIAYTEYEYLSINRYEYDDNGDIGYPGRAWISNWLVGGGIFQPIGNRGGGISLLLLYDITQDQYSPYNNPEIRVGFYF